MNGIIAVDKPASMTSFDVVAQIRKKLNTKVGHSGTLDPMATGLLIVALGKATKALPYIGATDKTYRVCCQLGIQTDSGDVWGTVTDERPVVPFSSAEIENAFAQLRGPMRQRVPRLSAKKVDGKKMYQYFREQVNVETLHTDITIHELRLLQHSDREIEFVADVSKGTYIRTLCEDLAVLLGTCGTMKALRRLRIGTFLLDDACPLEDIHEDMEIMSVKSCLAVPVISAPELAFAVHNGQRLSLQSPYDRVLVDSGEYYAIYEREDDAVFRSVRGLW